MSVSLRACRRIYSQSSISLWLRRISLNWEKSFTKTELDFGRDIYRSRHIQVLELNDTEAIISARFKDGDEPYCVLDFNENNDFTKRCSVNDALISAGLAVAGFYEIEELVGDAVSCGEYLFNPQVFEKSEVSIQGEDSDIVDTEKSEKESEQNASSGTADADSDGKSENLKVEENSLAETPLDGKRKLLLNFVSRRKGLSFSAFWSDEKKNRKVFGENAVEVKSLSSDEQELLFRLTSLARKSGFKYEAQNFVLSDFSKIPQFVSQTLKTWEKYFSVTLHDNVKLLALGEREVKLNSFAHGNGDSFTVDLRPSVGGVQIDANELPRLIGSAGALNILPSHGIVRVSTSDGNFIRKIEQSRDGGKIPRYILLGLGEFGNTLKLSPELKKWLDSLLKSRAMSKKFLPEFLRNYQKRGVSWADNLFRHGCNAMIADEMGLGKTVQTLTLMARYHGDSEGAEKGRGKKFLVVCPASVIPVWLDEAKKFFPQMKCGVLNATNNLKDASLWVASYTQLRRNKSLLDKTKFKIAVLDEAQFIKNPDTKTAVACMAIRAERKIALTGTPVENRPLDLWSAFRWLMPGLMGTRAAFDRVLENSEVAPSVIRKQISPFILRRLKSEVASELPEKIYVDLMCPMNPLQISEYGKLLDSARAEVKNSADPRGRLTVLSLLTRLRQVSCDAALLPWISESGGEHALELGGKMSVLNDKVEELFSGGKKILVFSQFTRFIDMAKNFFTPKIGAENIFELTGSTRDRARPVAEFQNRQGAALMFVSLRAGGTGITLSSADYVFIADPWWNPAVEEQAIDRVHRIGRKGDVFVYRMIARGSVEERVRDLQLKKRKIFDEILGGLKDVSSKQKFMETVADILE